MTEMIGLLRELLVYSLSMEADLRGFSEVCKTQGRDGQGEKAREFTAELDEVRHAERRDVNSSHCASRHSTIQTFSRKNGIRHLQKLCGTFDLLPSSFLLPQESINQESAPFGSGGYSSVFKATFKERAIVIKVLNVGAQAERERLHRVCSFGLES